MRELIFVYGTLRPAFNGKMSKWLKQHADFISAATFNGKLYMIDGYPGVLPSDRPEDLVYGDLFRMNEPDYVLRKLDHYEGCGDSFNQPTEYTRARKTILRDDGQSSTAWIYLYTLPVKSLMEISSGDFLDFQSNSEFF